MIVVVSREENSNLLKLIRKKAKDILGLLPDLASLDKLPEDEFPEKIVVVLENTLDKGYWEKLKNLTKSKTESNFLLVSDDPANSYIDKEIVGMKNVNYVQRAI